MVERQPLAVSPSTVIWPPVALDIASPPPMLRNSRPPSTSIGWPSSMDTAGRVWTVVALVPSERHRRGRPEISPFGRVTWLPNMARRRKATREPHGFWAAVSSRVPVVVPSLVNRNGPSSAQPPSSWLAVKKRREPVVTMGLANTSREATRRVPALVPSVRQSSPKVRRAGK